MQDVIYALGGIWVHDPIVHDCVVEKIMINILRQFNRLMSAVNVIII